MLSLFYWICHILPSLFYFYFVSNVWLFGCILLHSLLCLTPPSIWNDFVVRGIQKNPTTQQTKDCTNNTRKHSIVVFCLREIFGTGCCKNIFENAKKNSRKKDVLRVDNNGVPHLFSKKNPHTNENSKTRVVCVRLFWFLNCWNETLPNPPTPGFFLFKCVCVILSQ